MTHTNEEVNTKYKVEEDEAKIDLVDGNRNENHKLPPLWKKTLSLSSSIPPNPLEEETYEN